MKVEAHVWKPDVWGFLQAWYNLNTSALDLASSSQRTSAFKHDPCSQIALYWVPASHRLVRTQEQMWNQDHRISTIDLPLLQYAKPTLNCSSYWQSYFLATCKAVTWATFGDVWEVFTCVECMQRPARHILGEELHAWSTFKAADTWTLHPHLDNKISTSSSSQLMLMKELYRESLWSSQVSQCSGVLIDYCCPPIPGSHSPPSIHVAICKLAKQNKGLT